MAKCIQCPSKPCVLCRNDGDDKGLCTSCINNDMHVDENTHECVCDTSEFMGNDLETCKACTAPCHTCTNKGDDTEKCLTCFDVVHMDKEKDCACVDGYFINDI